MPRRSTISGFLGLGEMHFSAQTLSDNTPSVHVYLCHSETISTLEFAHGIHSWRCTVNVDVFRWSWILICFALFRGEAASATIFGSYPQKLSPWSSAVHISSQTPLFNHFAPELIAVPEWISNLAALQQGLSTGSLGYPSMNRTLTSVENSKFSVEPIEVHY